MKNVKTVLFNHWFSAIYNTIADIKQEFEESIRVIASSKNELAVYRNIADKFILEPPEGVFGYAKWALDTCIENDVDIFFCKRGMQEISGAKSEFQKAGIEVICEDSYVLYNISTKSATYGLLAGIDGISLPPYKVVTDHNELRDCIIDYIKDYGTAIVKYNTDEGGNSFRVISGKRSLDTLGLGAPIHMVSMDNIINSYRISELKGVNKPLIVMPYLEGPEVSVDCYLSKQGNIVIPRFKESKRVQRIKHDKTLMEMATKVSDALMLKYPCNIQFRYLNGYPVLLEANARISGGIHITNHCGINIIKCCLMDILGIEYTLKDFRDIVISQVETPVVLEG